MNVKEKLITISGCKNCPFNYDCYCCQHKNSQQKPIFQYAVTEKQKHKYPDWCPLRTTFVTIKLRTQKGRKL